MTALIVVAVILGTVLASAPFLLSPRDRDAALAFLFAGLAVVVGVAVFVGVLFLLYAIPAAFVYLGWNYALAPWAGWRPMPWTVAAVVGVALGFFPSVKVVRERRGQ